MDQIIAVSHDPPEADNRCSRWLMTAGCNAVTVRPAAGHPLPALALIGKGLRVLQSHWHGWYETPKGTTRPALVHDEGLGQWFEGFLNGWIGQPNARKAAAE